MFLVVLLSILTILGLVALIIYAVTGPLRERRISANHQELFLLVNDLLAIQKGGYFEVFPDEEHLNRAIKITNTYRKDLPK